MYAISNSDHVSIKEEVGPFQISVAFDNSCGKMINLGRGDIRIYRNLEDIDVTDLAFPGVTIVRATLANLSWAFEWCKENS